jgi:hypothetical protein
MNWYAVHVLTGIEPLEKTRKKLPVLVYENIHLVKAKDHEHAAQRAQELDELKVDYPYVEGKLDFKPARHFFIGIRKTIEIQPQNTRAKTVENRLDLAEVSYNVYRVKSKREALKLGKDEAVLVSYQE